MPDYKLMMEYVGQAVEAAGVLVVVAGMLFATGRLLLHHWDYRGYRQDIGRAILLGLEFLVAGDIIRTVVVETTLLNVGTLGLIVVIRVFLSFALEVELEGRWPWQHWHDPNREQAPPGAHRGDAP